MLSLPRAAALVALAVLCIALAPARAEAGGETLKRSAGNILQAPIDFVLSPVVAGKTVYVNLTNINDSTGVRYFYPVPGFVWLTGVQLGASVLRGVSGLFELLPGIGLLFFDREMTPLFDPVERGNALYENDMQFFRFKFGVDYTTPPV